jgi:glycosyltransferase involved in cell wall biosynthesis
MVQDGITGYLCRGDEEEFAEKTLALLKDPDLKKTMALAALKRAQELSADKMALRLESAYYGLINRKTRRISGGESV